MCGRRRLWSGRAPGQNSRALVQCGTIVVPAAIGRSGRSAVKREGDGATPIADMRLLYGFVRGDRIASPGNTAAASHRTPSAGHVVV